MDFELIRQWIVTNPYAGHAVTVALGVLVYFIARTILGRGLTALAAHTDNKVDDILVAKLKPFRIAWLAPLILAYLLAGNMAELQVWIEKGSLFLVLWIVIFTVNGLLDALNLIYESSKSYKGASIQGYLDILKLLIIAAGIIVSISLFSGQSPVALLTGLGALTAVLLLVFRDTILALVASVQIGTNDMVKEGDWIEVTSYEADGDVINMTLHTIKVQNWDKTISFIPTHKIMEVPFKNWRGMQESGGRRIKRAIHLDLGSIRFCDEEMLERFKRVDILKDYLEQSLAQIEREKASNRIVIDSPLDSRQLTNLGAYRFYIEAYLRAHPSIHQDGLTLLVRQLAPGPTGVPLELYVFTRTTEWLEYEGIQADIFDHLLAAVPVFDLRVFQEPTGMDFTHGFNRGS